MSKLKSLKWTYTHLKHPYKGLLNACMFLICIFFLSVLIHPAIVGLGLFAVGIVGTGVGNFYDQSAYQPDGSEAWYFRFIDKKTDAVISFGGSLGSVVVNNPGSGYSSAPTVAISAPASGTQATGTAYVSGGMVVQIRLTNAGAGYVAGDNVAVTFSGGGGTGATATAFLADGWHLGPGRLDHNIKAGQEESIVAGESNKPWTTRKQTGAGEIMMKLLQNDILTARAFGKYMSAYDCQVFIYTGPSRGDFFKGYIFVGKVRWPQMIDWKKGGENVDFSIKGTILVNKAVSITNSTDLPVASLVGVYSLAAGEMYSMDEEVLAPTIS